MSFLKKTKKKIIYIHIGFMKTGTSAIQSFLVQNSSFLKKNNLYFPEVNKKAMNYLGFSLLNEVPPYVHHQLDVDRVTLYKNLKTEITKAKEDNIIISTEAYSLMSTDFFLGDKAPILLKELLESKKFQFKIIASIRPQMDYVISQYNQHIKTHNFYSLYHGGINKFYEEKKELFNFNTVIKRWESVFGKENIILNVYEKQNDSVSTFLNSFNIDYMPQKEGGRKDVNSKMSDKGLQFMNFANKFDVIKQTAKQNYLLVDIIEDVLQENKKSKTLPEELINTIKKDCEKCNMALSKRYFNENTDWFTEDFNSIERAKVNVDNNLNIEEVVKIATAIWNHYQK
ncbi:hypothetical protein FG167_00740 [Lacinutrix sp. WUR7]|uniref:hypothetical protein n=1 Tax=Lacinutrix sp. WUR7 TaxID=2653681 RepID=UPI00193EB872|nr:hypothetical protein [Lacinutrix sp. WUR7]QRM87804.1 hypothetical protein FG167_00740 [Lacinutrix sp. WUR7]